MKPFLALAALVSSGIAFAGDCANCSSGGGLFSRRAERREARATARASSSCSSASTATASLYTEQPAVIRTESVYKTTKVGDKVTIVPSGAAKSAPAPK